MRLAYRSWGDRFSPVVLLLHSGASSSAQWKNSARGLVTVAGMRSPSNCVGGDIPVVAATICESGSAERRGPALSTPPPASTLPVERSDAYQLSSDLRCLQQRALARQAYPEGHVDWPMSPYELEPKHARGYGPSSCRLRESVGRDVCSPLRRCSIRAITKVAACSRRILLRESVMMQYIEPPQDVHRTLSPSDESAILTRGSDVA